MDSEDAVRRVRLLEKSVRLMLEAVRSNVVTTTIVPAGSDRYIGVNYFSRPSDTLLGILAGLEQLVRADQNSSSYLAMSQGAHGRARDRPQNGIPESRAQSRIRPSVVVRDWTALRILLPV